MRFDRAGLKARAAALAEAAKATAVEVGGKALEAAMARPEIRARVDVARQTLDAAREEVEARLKDLEADLWAWINKLQDEAQRQGRQAQRRLSAADHYRVLGLRPGASLPEVKRAWRQKMHAHHPDRFAYDPAAEARAHEEALKINAAYEALTALLTGQENRAR
ncbi:J domain-containing protein [Myxococcota bacterium]|nr:J domain-containing protein [Myxococcota bacterium]MBU1430918.1 J domain-containing protein [Myxococcota bacterium]MBU1898315.1 J domain-containing protein [Myxococcota bacterium]